MSYAGDMKNPLWQQRRLLILKRDNFKCQCPQHEGSHYNLELHHIDYIPGNEIWDYPDDMLMTTCYKCHHKELERYGAEKYLINAMKMKGFWIGDILLLACKFDTDEHFTKSLLEILRKDQNG